MSRAPPARWTVAAAVVVPGGLLRTVVAIPMILGVAVAFPFWLMEQATSEDTATPTTASGPDYSSENLSGQHLAGKNLRAADLSGTDLTGADLSASDLVEADFSGAVLVEVDLRGSRLERACLTRTDLSGATLTRADPTGAILDGVTWSNTTCPDGTNSDTTGDCDGVHRTP